MTLKLGNYFSSVGTGSVGLARVDASMTGAGIAADALGQVGAFMQKQREEEVGREASNVYLKALKDYNAFEQGLVDGDYKTYGSRHADFWENWSAANLDNLDADVRARVQMQIGEMTVKTGMQVSDRANAKRIDVAKADLISFGAEAAQMWGRDPAGQGQEALALYSGRIDAAEEAGVLSAVEAEKMRQDAMGAARWAEVTAATKADPYGVRDALTGGSGDYFAILKGHESGSDPNAQSTTSSAGGLYQFTDGTWAAVMRAHPELGLTIDGKFDEEQQELAIVAFTADNAKVLKASGITPNDKNLYLAHFLGSQGAVSFLKGMEADSSAPATDFVSEGAAAANKTIFYREDGTPRSLAEVYALQTRKFGGGVSNTGAFADLTLDEQEDLLKLADRQIAESQAAAWSELKPEVEAQVMQLRMGILPPEQLSQDAFIASFGPAEGLAAWGEYQQEWATAKTAQGMVGKAPADIQAMLLEARPAAGDPDFAAKAERYAVLLKAAEADNAARLADPAGYAVAHSPKVQVAYDIYAETNDPADLSRAITLSMEEQQRLGVPLADAMPLPQQAVSGMLMAWQQAGDDAGAKADLIGGVVQGLGDDATGRAVLGQLEAAGFPGDLAAVGEAYRSGNRSGAIRILQALEADEVTLTGEAKKELESAAVSAYEPFAEVLQMQAALTGDPSRVLMAQKQAGLIARVAAVSGNVDQAAADLFGHMQAVNDRGIVALVPAGTDEDALMAGLEAKKAEMVTGGYFATMTGAPDNRATRAILGAVAEDAYDDATWVNYDKGFALVLSDGSMVADKSGQVAVITLDQALAGGAQESANRARFKPQWAPPQ